MNQTACRAHGTIEPSEKRIGCNFWEPILSVSDLSWFERMFGDYVKVNLSESNQKGVRRERRGDTLGLD